MHQILWLASWYPNKLDPFCGDFIERHALAASERVRIHIISVIRDDSKQSAGSKSVEERIYNEQCSAEIVYYKAPKFRWRLLELLLSNWLYFRYNLQSIQHYLKKAGRPHCVHVHVGLRAGIPALWLKWTKRIPYVLSEHWSGIYSESSHGLEEKSWLFKFLWQLVVRRALLVTTVSRSLGEAVRLRFKRQAYEIVPNVVDANRFYPGPVERNCFHFAHASSLDAWKNPVGILQALARLRQRVSDPFDLFVFGEPSDKLRSLCLRLGIEQIVHFRGWIPQGEFAEDLRKCDCLILFSSYETFGCVVIEAGASGLPVIVSDIPVMHEIVVDGLTGVFAPKDQIDELAERMRWVIDNRHQFDPQLIRMKVLEKYDYTVVARQFEALYAKIYTHRHSNIC